MPPFGSDNTNTGNYLLRDVTAAEAVDSPERRQAKERQVEAQGLSLRLETGPTGPGDTRPNESIRAMRLPDSTDPRVAQMIDGAEVVADSRVANRDTEDPSRDRSERQRTYVDGSLDDKTVSDLAYTGKSREFLEAAREEINRLGEAPTEAVSQLMQDNRVIIFGEAHFAPNPGREFGSQIMSDLRNNGATHLALELDERAQPSLDEFMRTGEVSDDLRKTVQEYAPLSSSEDYYGLLKSARDAGLTLVAVDKQRGPTAEVGPGEPLPASAIQESQGRDAFMAERIKGILENSEAKVVVWAGKMHGTDPPGYIGSLAEQLRPEHKTACVDTEIPTERATLTQLTPDLKASVAIPTSSAGKISELPADRTFLPNKYSEWDYVLLFPQSDR